MTQPEHATFRIKDGTGAPIPVQFEPSSLQYTVQNQVVEQSGAEGSRPKDSASSSSPKPTPSWPWT